MTARSTTRPWLRSLWKSLGGTPPRAARRPARRLHLTHLEDRVTPVANVLANLPEANQGTLTTSFTQSETGSIAFGNTVVVAYNDSGSTGNHFTGYARSTDGGTTFTDLGVLGGNDDAGDPVFARDSNNGNIYLATLSLTTSTNIKMFRSTDNGLTFAAPVTAVTTSGQADKEWVAVDNFAGAGQGNVYLLTRDFGAVNGIVFNRSTDGGLTFSAPVLVTNATGNQGANLVVNSDHSLSAFWYQTGSVRTARSTNFGAIWSAPVTVSSLTTVGVNGDLGLSRSNTIATVFRSNAFPAVAASPTVAGNLYVAFADKGTAPDKSNIFFSQSTDFGATWSARTVVNQVTTNDQWQPSIRVTPNGLRLGIGWYDRRNDVNNTAIDYYARTAIVSGNTVSFGADFRVTDATFVPDFGRDARINGIYMGDYDQGSATNGTFYFNWADNRLGGPDVRVAAVPIAAGGPVVFLATPNGTAASASPIDLTFDQAMDPTSFSLAADVVAYTRGGVDVRSELTGFQWLNGNTTLRITNTSTIPGNYVLKVGPQILSVGGTPMDSDFDGTPGEPVDDQFTLNFVLPFPGITSSTPTGTVAPPVSSATFNFTQVMDTTSFSVAQDVFSFSGTAGNLIPFITGFTWVTSQQLRIDFSAQTLPGNYALVLNPTILNAGGFALDNNGNGIGGEIPGDRYTAAFSIGSGGGSTSNTFGYRFAATTFDATLDLVAGAPGVVTLALSGDDATSPLALGANNFNYYGTTFTSLFVSTNGNVHFGSANSVFSNTDLTTSPSQAFICPFWDDLNVIVASADSILYQFTADNRLIVNWKAVHFFAGSTTDPITFQAVFQLNTGATAGTITYNYVDLDSVGSAGTGGVSATVGIKNAGTTPATGDPLVVAFNGGGANFGLVGSGRAIRIFKNSAPTAVANGPYTVASGGTVVLSSAGTTDPEGDPLTFIWDLDGDGTFGETGPGALRGDETGPSPTFNAVGLAGGAYPVALRVVDPSGEIGNATATVNVSAAAPQVASALLNGTTAVQRSSVRSLVVTFDSVVNLPTNVADAFQLTKLGAGTGDVTLTGASQVVGTQTVVTLTFSGLFTEGGGTVSPNPSLIDGNYRLTVRANMVSNSGGQLNGGNDFVLGNAASDNLFRFFGDNNGDRTLSGGDFGAFRGTFGLSVGQTGYIDYFDFNGDGTISGGDFGNFRTRFGTTLPFP